MASSAMEAGRTTETISRRANVIIGVTHIDKAGEEMRWRSVIMCQL